MSAMFTAVGIGVGFQVGIALVLWTSAALERRFVIPATAEQAEVRVPRRAHQPSRLGQRIPQSPRPAERAA